MEIGAEARRLIRNIRVKVRAVNNLRRSLISLEIRRGIPRLVLQEKYEPRVRWSPRFLTAVGILLSVVSIPAWYFNLLVALLLAGAEQFLERSIFQYTSIYVMPLPTFTYDPTEWVATVYAFA